MRTPTLSLLVPVLLATPVGVSHAQQVSTVSALALQEPAPDLGSPGGSIGGGIGLGVVGFLAGGLAGVAMTSDCASEEYCELEGAFVGAAAGGTFGMALGVHLGDRRRGNLALDFVTGAAVWGAGIGIAAASHWDDTATTVMFVAIPIAQLVSTVAVERAVGRSRLGTRQVNVSIIPRLEGGATLLGRVAL